jgi:hypothetical protein
VAGPAEAVGASYRDPHGFVYRRDDVLFRQVGEAHRENFDRFIGSGLYEALVHRDLLIPHEEVDIAFAARPGAYRVLRPQLVPFVSYPYEWCFSQLRDAANLTLRVQEGALEHGMSLRDASAFNVTFHRGKPIFIDTTSFEVLREGAPWVAYRQFCEQFLAPLALCSYRDARLGQLTRAFPDGIPLDMTAALLPARTRMRPGLAMHVRMHARSQRRHEKDEVPAPDRTEGRFSLKAFHGLLESLRSAIDGLAIPSGPTTWGSYYEEAGHYPESAIAAKEAFVDSAIDTASPSSVWDLGANTGQYARRAADRGIPTVAMDLDTTAVERAYVEARGRGDAFLLPLVGDLVNPSPGVGWANDERSSLRDRGPADLVMALALVHHVAIGRNVPLGLLIDELARLGRWIVLEWVPKTDPRVAQLLRHREDVFADYREEVLRDEIGARLQIVDERRIDDTDRLLFLLRR